MDIFLYQGKCYQFIWHAAGKIEKMSKLILCQENHDKYKIQCDIKNFNFIFNAISTTFPPIIIQKNKSIIIVTYQRYFDNYYYQYTQVYNSMFEGYYICQKQYIQ